MPDISQTLVAKSDQLNGDDLIGGPRTITVRAVSVRGEDQPVAVSYEGDGGKPYKPCLSMRRVLAHVWGHQSEGWIGKRMTLYRNPDVRFGDMEVGGIRISHLSDIAKARIPIPLTATRGRKVQYVLERLGDAPAPQEQEPTPPLSPDLRERALLAARQGTVTFQAFWMEPEVKKQRPALLAILEECKKIAKAADEAGAPTEADPFSGDAREREPGEEG